jgi:hypothetical protein
LIVLSWFAIVTPELGWTGFVISLVAVLVSYVPAKSASSRRGEPALLTRAMLGAKDHGYHLAVQHMHRGGAVFFDGLVFTVRHGELRLVIGTAWPLQEMDEVRALQDAERAQREFEEVARQSPEVAAAAADKKIRVTVLSDFSGHGFEVCQIAEGQVEWRSRGRTGKGLA